CAESMNQGSGKGVACANSVRNVDAEAGSLQKFILQQKRTAFRAACDTDSLKMEQAGANAAKLLQGTARNSEYLLNCGKLFFTQLKNIRAVREIADQVRRVRVNTQIYIIKTSGGGSFSQQTHGEFISGCTRLLQCAIVNPLRWRRE